MNSTCVCHLNEVQLMCTHTAHMHAVSLTGLQWWMKGSNVLSTSIYFFNSNILKLQLQLGFRINSHLWNRELDLHSCRTSGYFTEVWTLKLGVFWWLGEWLWPGPPGAPVGGTAGIRGCKSVVMGHHVLVKPSVSTYSLQSWACFHWSLTLLGFSLVFSPVWDIHGQDLKA